jgi:hypothetical protein
MKKSPRRKYLINKLKKLKLKYKIFYGLEGKNSQERKIVYSYYNREKVIKYLGREMGYNEIAGHYTGLRMFKYAVKKKFENAIFFDDDFYPSFLLKKWIDEKVYVYDNQILQFHCKAYGFLKKNNIRKVLNNKVKIYQSKTHLNNFGASQWSYQAMKKFLILTEGKVVGVGDYPIDLIKNKFQLMQTVPFLGYPDDRDYSFLQKDRDYIKYQLDNKLANFFKQLIARLAPGTKSFFKSFYYLSFLKFFLSKEISFHSYFVHYFHKAYCELTNFFLNCYISVDTIHSSIDSYPKDLKKYYFKNKKFSKR